MLLTPTQAEKLILQHPPSLSTESVSLQESPGRILAQELVADRPLPPYDRVMMDGISFRNAEAGEPPHFKIAGIHAAGDAEAAPLPAGQCWEIMTGANLPGDCDTVVPYEETDRVGDDEITANPEAISPGKHIHRQGSDFAQGDLLVPSGLRIDSRIAAVAATIGATCIDVLRKPRVAIFTTGDEVVPPSEQPAPHQVRQSNYASLAAALQKLGAEIAHYEHLLDDEELTTRALRDHLEVDLVLLCGGISKGKRDYVRPVVEGLLGEPVLHGIAQRPGKPLAFWQGPPSVFALPGNPMSVQVTFHRYVRPFLDRMNGQLTPDRTVELSEAFQFAPPFTYFLPVTIEQAGATLRATPRTLANSGDFASAIPSSGFLELPGDQSDFPQGFLATYRDWL